MQNLGVQYSRAAPINFTLCQFLAEEILSIELSEQFHQAMLGIYDAALNLNPTYRAKSFLQMVNVHGGREAANRLLATRKPSPGFTELYLRGTEGLHLSLEYLVLQSTWQPLFLPDQLDVARKRLRDVGCKLPAEGIP